VIVVGKAQVRKGYRGEYNLVRKLKEAGCDVKRIPLSGRTDFAKGDIQIIHPVAEGIGEVKVRKMGFRELYKWLGKMDYLFLKADHRPYLVVMKLDRFLQLLKEGRE